MTVCLCAQRHIYLQSGACFCGKTGSDLGVQLQSTASQVAFTESVFPHPAKEGYWEEGKPLLTGTHLPLCPYPRAMQG